MIRKVPNIRAWVLKSEDIDILIRINPDMFRKYVIIIYNLPILDSRPPCINTYWSDVILVTNETPHQKNLCLFNEDGTMKIEYIEEINKIWNKFYD